MPNTQHPSSKTVTDTSVNIIQVVSSQAEALKLSPDRLQPQGNDQVQVWFQKVEFKTLMTWLSNLEEQGILIKSISIDKTPASGYVSTQVVFSRKS